MKGKLKIMIVALFASLSMSANAAWVATEISHVQLNMQGNVIFVYFTEEVDHDICGADRAGAILRPSNNLFEEMYARILIAEQNGDPVDVLSTHGTCTSAFIENPYIRFGL